MKPYVLLSDSRDGDYAWIMKEGKKLYHGVWRISPIDTLKEATTDCDLQPLSKSIEELLLDPDIAADTLICYYSDDWQELYPEHLI